MHQNIRELSVFFLSDIFSTVWCYFSDYRSYYMRYNCQEEMVFTLLSYTIKLYIPSVVNNIFVWLSIYFKIIWMKILYNDSIIKKVVCAVFLCLYLWFCYSFLIYIINVKLVLICSLCCEMIINVFVLINVLSDNSKY